jgi:hypothetical protein
MSVAYPRGTFKPLERGIDRIRGVHPYVDRVCLWLPQQLSDSRVEWLRERSGDFYEQHDHSHRYFRHLRQRLDLKQPSHEAMQDLADINGHFLNWVEPALDFTCEHEVDVERAEADLRRHSYKPYLRRGVRIKETTRYTNPRTSPTNLADYSDERAQKVTGKPCVHIEWKLQNRPGVLKAGLDTLGDLLKLNCRKFWEPRLILLEPDLPKLGRLLAVHVNGNSRRSYKPHVIHVGKFQYPSDHMLGAITFQACGSVQQLLKDYGAVIPNLRSCLVGIDVRNLLPSPTLYYDNATITFRLSDSVESSITCKAKPDHLSYSQPSNHSSTRFHPRQP